MSRFKHDVSFSFAGAQRAYVRSTAHALKAWGVEPFFDEDFETEMWGRDLNEYLQDVYLNNSRFVVIFASSEYASSAFPTEERRSAFAAAMHGATEVLPVRFDQTRIPGLNPNLLYLNASEHTPEELARKLVGRLRNAGVSVNERRPGTITPRPRSAHANQLEVVVTDHEGQSVIGAKVAIANRNGTLTALSEGAAGSYRARVPVEKDLELWIAHPEYSALVIEAIDPGQDVAADLGRPTVDGSAIFFGSTGNLPSPPGRLNPIHDSQGRHYVYIDNAAVGGKPAAPYAFEIGVPFEVEDASSSVTVVKILRCTGNGSLIEYQLPE